MTTRMEKRYAFDDEECLARMHALTEYWRVKYAVESEWDGGTVRFVGRKMGVKYDATVTMGEGRIAAVVKVGFLAEKLGGPRYVEGKVDTYLDPAISLEELQARIPS